MERCWLLREPTKIYNEVGVRRGIRHTFQRSKVKAKRRDKEYKRQWFQYAGNVGVDLMYFVTVLLSLWMFGAS